MKFAANIQRVSGHCGRGL